MSKKKTRIVILASGRGSNFEALLQGIKEKKIQNAKVFALICDKEETGAQSIANKNSIPVFVLNFSSFENKQSYEKELKKCLEGLEPDLILCLGYRRILSLAIIETFPNSILNIHPSLLPAFPGLEAQQQALDYGVHYTGVSIHFIDKGVDTGPILAQKVVKVLAQDNKQSLSQRILKEEHNLLVETISRFCQEKLKITGRKIYFETNSPIG